MKDMSLISKITLFVISALVVCSASIGVFAYILNRNEVVTENARKALSIAQTVVSALNHEQFAEIMATKNPNEYYEKYTEFLDSTLEKCNLTYLYILDRNYNSDVIYFAEGYPYTQRPDEPEILLGDTETVEAYAPELFETLNTGKDTITGVYDMGGYGKMVSGFSAILDDSGNVLGVAGVDLAINEVVASAKHFGLIIILISGLICLIAAFFSVKLIKTIISELNGIFDGINAVTVQVSGGTSQITDSSQSVAQGSAEQMASIELLFTGIQALIDDIKQNAVMTNEAMNICTLVKSDIEKGNNQISQISAAMNEINNANLEIENVIHVIDEIAKQVNILALNASVEAVRSGEYGKGFSVVAEEVRGLAAKVAEAAKNTNNFIESSMAKVTAGEEIVRQTSINLNKIVEGVDRSVEIVDNISKFYVEQETHIHKINQDISNISKAIQQNNAAAEESASACQEINAQSATLHDMVSRYRIN